MSKIILGGTAEERWRRGSKERGIRARWGHRGEEDGGFGCD
jgi:hypothetical protein